MSDLRFEWIDVEKFIDEAQPLFVRHREEIAKVKDLMVLDVDKKFYLKVTEDKYYRVVAARDMGRMVGYFAWLIYRHPHYALLCAQEDVHYLLPEHRMGLNGYLLMREAKEMLRPLGVRYFTMREKVGHEHPAIMKRLGLTPEDVVYSGRLD